MKVWVVVDRDSYMPLKDSGGAMMVFTTEGDAKERLLTLCQAFSGPGQMDTVLPGWSKALVHEEDLLLPWGV